MDQEKCNIKVEENFLKDVVPSVVGSTEELEFIDFHKDPDDFSCVSSYDISSSSLIKSPLISELLISHGLLSNGHKEDSPVCDLDAESKWPPSSYGPPSFLRVYSLQPPPIHSTTVEDNDVDDEERGDYKCGWKSCDMCFSSRKDLAQHVNNAHVSQDENSLYRCHWNGCIRQGKAIHARYRMLIHIKTHTHEKPHACEKKIFKSETIKNHARSHAGQKPNSASAATKVCSSSSDCLKQSKTQEDKPYVCRVDGCDKRYTDPSSLLKHMKSSAHCFENHSQNNLNSQESGNGDLQMETSDIERPSQPNLPNSVVSNISKPYACKVEGCNKRYTDPSSLRKHQRATSHGRDPNSPKLKISKTLQNKKSIPNSQVSNGAISKVTEISEPSEIPDIAPKELSPSKALKNKKSGRKKKFGDTVPLDLSVGCLVVDSVNGSHDILDQKEATS